MCDGVPDKMMDKIKFELDKILGFLSAAFCSDASQPATPLSLIKPLQNHYRVITGP